MGNYDYIQTRNQIIAGAYRIVGATQLGQPLSAEMQQEAIDALQLLVKHWSNKHLFLWSFNESSFTTVNGTAGYAATLDQTIIGLDKAWILDSNNNIQVLLDVIPWAKYEEIFNKGTSSGVPTVIAYKSTPAPQFYLYPTPDAVYTVVGLCVFPLKDLDNDSDSGDIPVRFQKALKYGLAEDLSDEYPMEISMRQMISAKATLFFKEAKGGDMPQETHSEVEGLFATRRLPK